MFARSRAFTGIDLGTTCVKLARASGNGRPERLLNAALAEVGEAASGEWETAAAAALKSLLRQLDLKPRELGRVATSISGPSVHIRQVDLPPLSHEELRSSLKFEVRKHFSLENPAQAALDCQVLERPAAPTPMKVLLAGAPEALVASRVRVLESVGIQPETVDALPLALLNGLQRQPVFKEGQGATFALVDLGATVTTIVISRRGGVLYARSLPATGALEGTNLSSLTGPFRETAQFYASINQRRSVDQVCLCGGGALTPDLDRRLEEALALPVSRLNLAGELAYAPAGSGSMSPDMLEQCAPQLATALGLLYWGATDVSN